MSSTSCAGPGDFNTQLQQWFALVNTRRRRALGCAPTERIAADKAAMLSLPPVAPAVGWRASTRLARDHYVRVDSNDYSIHPGVIGRRIELIVDLHRVKALCDGRGVADHDRAWAWHQTISAPDHVSAANALRRERVGVLRPVAEPEVEQRCLADYDTALGIDTDDTEGGVIRQCHGRRRNWRPRRRHGVSGRLSRLSDAADRRDTHGRPPDRGVVHDLRSRLRLAPRAAGSRYPHQCPRGNPREGSSSAGDAARGRDLVPTPPRRACRDELTATDAPRKPSCTASRWPSGTFRTRPGGPPTRCASAPPAHRGRAPAAETLTPARTTTSMRSKRHVRPCRTWRCA